MSDRHVRGFFVLGVEHYATAKLPPSTQTKVKQAQESFAVKLPELKKNDWYPLSHVVDQCAAIEAEATDPDSAYDELKRCGQFIANDAASTFLKLLIKVLTPKLFARQFPEIWKRYHDFGELTADLAEIDNNKVIFYMPGYTYLAPLASGWIEYVFNAFGKSDVEVTTNNPPGTPVPETVRFDVAWS